jgi:hypothetical protein
MASSAAPWGTPQDVETGFGYVGGIHHLATDSVLRHRQAIDLPQGLARGSEPCHASRCSKPHRGEMPANAPERATATSGCTQAKKRAAVTEVHVGMESVFRDVRSASRGKGGVGE